jgi:hypothetical protein
LSHFTLAVRHPNGRQPFELWKRTTPRAHGGAAPQTKAKAQRRLQQAADTLVQRLLSFALDGKVTDPVALQAIGDALDRAGLTPKTAVEIGVALKPWETVMETIEMESGSCAEFRRSHGIEDDSDSTENTPCPGGSPA